MLILDDILLLPLRGALCLFREIYNAAEQESENEAEAVRKELQELYMMLETGRITEEQFNAGEEQLLDRLEEMESSEK
jgi:hypothetical protein